MNARLFQPWCLALAIVSLAASRGFAQIGVDEKGCEKTYGVPVADASVKALPPAESVKVYSKGGCRVVVEFMGGVAAHITYVKQAEPGKEPERLSEAERLWLLAENAGGKKWDATLGGQPNSDAWTRRDGDAFAAAFFDQGKSSMGAKELGIWSGAWLKKLEILGRSEQQCTAVFGAPVRHASDAGAAVDPPIPQWDYEYAGCKITVGFLDGKAEFARILPATTSGGASNGMVVWLAANAQGVSWQLRKNEPEPVFEKSDKQATATMGDGLSLISAKARAEMQTKQKAIAEEQHLQDLQEQQDQLQQQILQMQQQAQPAEAPPSETTPPASTTTAGQQ